MVPSPLEKASRRVLAVVLEDVMAAHMVSPLKGEAPFSPGPFSVQSGQLTSEED